jgi:ribonuclease I
MAAPKRRRRRTASIATLLAGAIGALVVQCVGLNPSPKPQQNPDKRAENESKVPAPLSKAPSEKQSDLPTDAFYQLVLTITPAFCELNTEHSLCGAGKTKANSLTLHGLWPEQLHAKRAPANCKGMALDTAATFDARLARWMPGPITGAPMYQWNKHGSCSGLKPLRYFEAAVNWAERVEKAVLPALDSGKALSSVDIKASASLAWPANGNSPALGAAMTLHCKRIKTPSGTRADARQAAAHLLEIRVCLSSGTDFAPAQLVECAALDRIDQGCGKQFWVDS